MNKDIEFIDMFNEYYPFERYIVKEPKKINYLFDDALLTEIFIPGTEIEPIVNEKSGRLMCFTSVVYDEIYIKLKCGESEIRMAYYDFAEHIREEITYIIIEDFGGSEWQDLYVETEDYSDLKKALELQKELIIEKYGECKIKDNFSITNTIKLLN